MRQVFTSPDNRHRRMDKSGLVLFILQQENAMQNQLNRFMRYTLGSLLAFGAINAFAGGYYAMAGADGVPPEWLKGSPFENYFLPGLILFVVVGGAFLIAAFSVFANLRFAKRATFGSVVIVSFWLVVQVAIIGYVSWMQPTTATVTLVILFLGNMLPKQNPPPILNSN